MLETNELNQVAMIMIPKNKSSNKIVLPGRFCLDILQYQLPLQ